jgi:hypothetical protein
VGHPKKGNLKALKENINKAPSKSPPVGETFKKNLKPSLPGRVWVGLNLILNKKMKLRITPLNFATAFFLFLAVYIWLNGASITGMQFTHLGGAISLIFLLFALVVSFMDIMFRNFFPQLKKLWLIELSFITLATIIFLLVK